VVPKGSKCPRSLPAGCSAALKKRLFSVVHLCLVGCVKGFQICAFDVSPCSLGEKNESSA